MNNVNAKFATIVFLTTVLSNVHPVHAQTVEDICNKGTWAACGAAIENALKGKPSDPQQVLELATRWARAYDTEYDSLRKADKLEKSVPDSQKIAEKVQSQLDPVEIAKDQTLDKLLKRYLPHVAPIFKWAAGPVGTAIQAFFTSSEAGSDFDELRLMNDAIQDQVASLLEPSLQSDWKIKLSESVQQAVPELSPGTLTVQPSVNNPGFSYAGQTTNGFPNGFGTFKFTNGPEFAGKVDMANPSIGTMSFPSGDFYAGPVNEHGKPNGRGTFRWKGGMKFKGTFANGDLVKGDVSLPNGSSFTGDFHDGKPDGEGTFTSGDGKKVEGTFARGELVKGKVSLPDGSSFTGDFHDGQPDGHTEARFPNGNRFDGTYVKGIPTQGTFSLKDGTTYTASLKGFMLEGQGTARFPDGSIFEGNFENGAPTEGTYSWKDGTKQTGPLKDGAFEGRTQYIRPDGTRYEGNWSHGHAEGQGTVFRTNGSRVAGPWTNGHLDVSKAKVIQDGRERDFSPGDAKGEENMGKDGWNIRAWDGDGRFLGGFHLEGFEKGATF